jgi:hypothetical protein
LIVLIYVYIYICTCVGVCYTATYTCIIYLYSLILIYIMYCLFSFLRVFVCACVCSIGGLWEAKASGPRRFWHRSWWISTLTNCWPWSNGFEDTENSHRIADQVYNKPSGK